MRGGVQLSACLQALLAAASAEAIVARREQRLPPAKASLQRPPAKTARLVFLGDISAVANRKVPEIDRALHALIASADLVVGNCESPVVERARYRLGTVAGTRHAMTPRFLAEVLAVIGAAPDRLLLSLANNHILDQGVAGYEETQAALAGLGIGTIGGAEDPPVRTVELKGLSLGFAAFTEWRNAAAADFAGRVTMLDALAGNDCAALRYSKSDHLCIVAHWDREFRHFPRPSTRALAEDFAEAGAALIVGHHAHVLQPAEMIGDTLVAYGLRRLPGHGDAARSVAVAAWWKSWSPTSASTRGPKAGSPPTRWCPSCGSARTDTSGWCRWMQAEGEAGELLRQRFAAVFPEGEQELPAATGE